MFSFNFSRGFDSKQNMADSPSFRVLEYVFRTAEEILNVSVLTLLSQYPP